VNADLDKIETTEMRMLIPGTASTKQLTSLSSTLM
jgi:hypothetical protein